jgi:hypothetical protein
MQPANEKFHALMKSMWQHMDIELPETTHSEVYTLTFPSQIEVHLLHSKAGKIDIISEAGTLQNKNSAPVMLDLLSLNHPKLKLNVDRSSGVVMVWTRQEIDAMDMEVLPSLIIDLVKAVLQAKQSIDCSSVREVFVPTAKRIMQYTMPVGDSASAQLRRKN